MNRWIQPAGIVAAALALACAGGGTASKIAPKVEQPSRLPGAKNVYRVTAVVERGEYLDALLARGSQTLRFFFPASAVCRSVVRIEWDVQYKTVALLGTVENRAGVCESAGIGSLEAARDRRPRQSSRILPRGNASYKQVYRDADLSLVRGRFPYANQIGWVGGWDTLAALPRSPACDAAAERGSASIEFRVAGPIPYQLLSGETPCPIDGFLKPLPPSAVAAETPETPATNAP